MASVYKEAFVPVPPAQLWARVRDVGGISQLFPGLIRASEMTAGNTRACTLADGSKLAERILAVDDEHHRVAYTMTAAPAQPAYHHASMQVFPEGQGCRLVWITDIEPGDAAAAMGQALDTALADLAETARGLPAAAR